ncbi:MAG: ATP-binding protein, partial [Woeseiaceae bacterium]
DDHSRIALVLLNLSDTYLDLGKLQQAEDHVQRAIMHADQGDIMRWRYAGRLQQAYLLLEQDRSEEALVALHELETSEVLKGEPRQLARLRILFADAYKSAGDMESAMAAAEESLAIVEALGDRWRAAMWSIELARLQRLNGNSAEALRIIESVESFARPDSRDRLLRAALAEKAEILLDDQQPGEAFFALQESRDIESRMASREAEEQLWLMSTTEAAQASRLTIAELRQRSLVAERQADLNLFVRNALLIAIALALSAGLYWRTRSVRTAPKQAVEQRTGDIQLEASLAAEEQVGQRQKLEAISRVTGGIAQDFNNLLTVVNGALELLKTNAGGRLEKQHLQLIEEALSAGTAGAAITKQLLSFSRKNSLEPERFDLVRHVRNISSLLRGAAGEQTVLRINLPDGPIQVDLDRGQFTTALLNLVMNSRDAVTDAGEIDITVEHEWISAEEIRKAPELISGVFVSISVRDNGCGMTTEEVRQAFQPFYSTQDVSTGAGLGLSMVYGFARQSYGTATIDSSAQTGTTVKLLLPVAERLTDLKLTAPSAIKPDCRGRALVIEDQDEVRVVACAFLESMGFEAVGAESTDKAVTMIELGFEPCFLFIDIDMPGSMNGGEFATWAHEKLPDAEILLTTGFSDVHNHGDCPFPILHKPYRMEELNVYLSARFGNAHNDQPE